MTNDSKNASFFKRTNSKKLDHKSESLDRIESLLKEILYNSLAQAIIKTILTPHLVLKVFLLIFVLGSSGFASYLIIQSLLAYFSYGVITISRTIYETPTLFPKVTICNTNEFTTEYAYNLTQQGIFNGSGLTNEEKKLVGHDLNDILFDCWFNNIECNSSSFVWSYDQFYGNCYTFNSGIQSNGTTASLKQSKISGPDCGLQFEFYVNIYEELMGVKDLVTGIGAIVRIGNSSYSTYDSNNGIFISSGTSTYLSVNREFKSMLSKPYSNCEIDSNSPAYLHGLYFYNLIGQSQYAYSQQLCFSQCLQKYFIQTYNCTYPNMLSLFNVSECSTDHFDIIFSDNVFDSNYISDECTPLCPLECNQTLYATSYSFNQLNGNQFVRKIKKNPNLLQDFNTRSIDSITTRESMIKLYIFYDTLSYTLTEESPQMDWIYLLGSIGGNLGLFLGVSVFSLGEVVEVIIEIIFIFKSSKKIAVSNKRDNTVV